VVAGQKKRREKQDKVAIDLWDHGQLCRRPLRPSEEEVREVRNYWLNPIATLPAQHEPNRAQLKWHEIGR
jgi:hypothetical protein